LNELCSFGGFAFKSIKTGQFLVWMRPKNSAQAAYRLYSQAHLALADEGNLDSIICFSFHTPGVSMVQPSFPGKWRGGRFDSGCGLRA
jgi:hypothetical protein